MTKRISFDKEAVLGYIKVVRDIRNGSVEVTDELDINPFISIDLDRENRIVGLEVFGEETKYLENASQQDIYLKNTDVYSLRLNDKKVVSRFTYLGIDFCFSENDYKGFVGYDIIDFTKYPENIL